MEFNQVEHQNNAHGVREIYIEQSDIPRPCYYLLRILGIWQPEDCHLIWRCYNIFVCLLWFAVMVAAVALGFIGEGFRIGKIINSFGTIMNLGCPFLVCRYYFSNSNYDELLIHIIQCHDNSRTRVSKLSSIYTAISLLAWCLTAAFFYIHWLPFFQHLYQYLIYSFVVFYTIGCWACWLSVYGFVCHVHKYQINCYIHRMKELYGYSSRTSVSENACIAELLSKFTDLRLQLEKTQKDFSLIISFAVSYHIFDLCVFSVAYWRHDFGRYPLWQYIGGVCFDIFSILIKLYPAAVVCQTLHKIVITAGEHCCPDINHANVPEERFLFYKYINLREQDMGFQILGVKITSKLTVGIFVTLATAGLTFLHYAVPFLNNIVLKI